MNDTKQELKAKISQKAETIKAQFDGTQAVRISKSLFLENGDKLTKSRSVNLSINAEELKGINAEDKTLAKMFFVAFEKRKVKDTLKI